MSVPSDDLSPREREVLALYATGATHREIADELVISPKTVEAHVQQIRRKCGGVTRLALAVEFYCAHYREERDRALACVGELGRAIEESVCGMPSRPSMDRWLALIDRAKSVYGGDFPAYTVEGSE